VVFPPYNRNRKIFSRAEVESYVPVGVEKDKFPYPKKKDIGELIKTAARLGFTRIVTQDIVPPSSKKQIYLLIRIE